MSVGERQLDWLLREGGLRPRALENLRGGRYKMRAGLIEVWRGKRTNRRDAGEGEHVSGKLVKGS